MSDQIIEGIRAVSYVIVLIILAVMANTMSMSTRERIREYATMKALGFKPRFLVTLIFLEGLVIASLGGSLGVVLTDPAASLFQIATDNIFPLFVVSQTTVTFQICSSILVGFLAATGPAISASRIRVVEGLRTVP